MWHSEKVATSKVYDKPALAFLVGPAYFKEVLLWHNTWKLKPREFKADEIRIALKQMHPTKALGPDGMSLIFYKKYRDVVGSNVINCPEYSKLWYYASRLEWVLYLSNPKGKMPTEKSLNSDQSVCVM